MRPWTTRSKQPSPPPIGRLRKARRPAIVQLSRRRIRRLIPHGPNNRTAGNPTHRLRTNRQGAPPFGRACWIGNRPKILSSVDWHRRGQLRFRDTPIGFCLMSEMHRAADSAPLVPASRPKNSPHSSVPGIKLPDLPS